MATERDFAAFYDANFTRLVVQLYAVTGNRQDAEDVVQEAFARACGRWRWVQSYEAPEAWVRRVAMNLALQLHRRLRTRLAALARLGPSGEATVLFAEQVELVDALARLPLRHRQMLALHYLADLSLERIADELRIPVGTAKSRLSRARAALAWQLDGGKEADRDAV
jgi:RNA polymerase sigma-70 factor, ECF subfamily